ncbi:glycoside hydrolase/phage tail family protein [Leisingera daeponensis]|uniref:baseplate multidomain protein megatron n=1 Tax=Leisingera daeponensis TaxID=405746 RepID=UPI001C983DCA|nr:glycoside hydrolase/phage tail family protein [Leisingera daeponensis]MBY6055375.1 glycoside hydrolase/phage tail family protein [Leisingera daeponensis]
MATLALGIAGTAIGASIGGGVAIGAATISAATIGGMVGSAVGSVVDSMIIASMMPDQRIDGARLDSLTVTTSTEGSVIPRVYGRSRVGGNIIWATDFREEITETTQGGGKGGGPSVTSTTYNYYASFAVALCDGPITGIGRIWADGDLMDLENATYRVYLGTEDQSPDTFISSKMGADQTPAYRGTAYIVFEELHLEAYGNRLPQISVEVFRPVVTDDTAEGMVRSVTMIPGAGEFVYATTSVTQDEGDGETAGQNTNARADRADFLEALDALQASAPNVESVSLVVSWFGDDLRAGEISLRPGVEYEAKDTSIAWSVNGVDRENAYLVSQDIDGRPVFGGTPADFSVVEAIQEIKARGLRVTFYPFVLMDVPSTNTLPDPYSDNGATTGQAAFPWRGRITCSPAAGYAGTPDKTAAAATQVAAFFGDAAASDFEAYFPIIGYRTYQVRVEDLLETVTEPVYAEESGIRYTGPAEWSYRRMILHYAHICASAGGVDTFLIGSELPGITTVRDGAGSYPAVDALVDLAADVSGILGAGTDISYAADWTEYFGHQPSDGSGDVYFHLDPLWASANVDFIGIDNYMPLSDWRDGFEHLDAQAWPRVYDRDYLQSNIEGGEGFDWYYANPADRTAQVRTPITDGALGKPWVFRYKDLRSWWSNQHYNRPGGVESGTPTAWTPQSKPIRFTEFGCPAIDRGANQPNVFYDPKSSESAVPFFSRGWRDDAMQRAYIEATLDYWAQSANNPDSAVYAAPMVDLSEASLWTWDARPYPTFPALTDAWSDGGNWHLGHWANGRVGAASVRGLVRELCERAGMAPEEIDVSGLYGHVEGYSMTTLESARASISVCAAHFGFDATESMGVIRFAMRGAAPTATVTVDDLVEGEGGEPFEIERGQETELPQALKWTVLRSDEEYDQVSVEARRRTVSSARITSESIALVVPPEEAERRVNRSLMERWVGREAIAFSLPPSRVDLDPMDVVTLSHDGRAYDFRLQAIGDGEARTAHGILSDRAAYDLPPGRSRDSRISARDVYGPPSATFMNLPQLREDQLEHQPLLAVYARPWPGSMAVYKSPELDGYNLLASTSARAKMGVTASTFPAGPVSRWDDASELLVDMGADTLTGVTDAAALSGENVFAVEVSNGVWEVFAAARADLVSPGQYRLSRMLRGLRGTEDTMADDLPAGAQVVVLSASTVRALPIDPVEVGLQLNWLVGPASKPISDDAYLSRSFIPLGRGLRPFSPAQVQQPYRTPRTSSDLTISWIRRSRSLVADNWEVAEVPLSEETESYEVDIMNGATVLRTLTSSSPSVVYTAGNQTSDFGSLLGPGDSLDIRIYQISTTYGRGAPLSETLIF